MHVPVKRSALLLLALSALACGKLHIQIASQQVLPFPTPTSERVVYVGSGTGGFADGPALKARVGGDLAAASDSTGTLYIADADNNRFRKVTPDGVVSTLAGTGKGALSVRNGPGRSVDLSASGLIGVDGSGTVYFNTGGAIGSGVLRKIAPDGTVSFVGGATPLNLAAGGADVGGIAIDGAGTFYVLSAPQQPGYAVWNLVKVTQDGTRTMVFQSHGAEHDEGIVDGASTVGTLGGGAMTFDSNGNIYIAQTDDRIIRKVTPSGTVSTLAGSGARGTADGRGTAAQFDYPIALVVDAQGVVYVADGGAGSIRKVTPDGTVSTVANVCPPPKQDVRGTNPAWSPSWLALTPAGDFLFYCADQFGPIWRLPAPSR
jgi:hypothetical protein